MVFRDSTRKLQAESTKSQPSRGAENRANGDLLLVSLTRDRLLVDLVQMDILDVPRQPNAEILNIFQLKYRRARCLRSFDPEELSAIHVVQIKDWPRIRLAPGKFNIRKLDIVYVAYKEPARRNFAEPVRLRVSLFHLRHHPCCHLGGSAAAMLHIKIVDLNVLNRVGRNPHDEARTAELRSGVVADNIADDHSFQRAHRNSRRTAHTASQAQKQRRVGAVTHRDPGKSNILQKRPIHALERKAAATIKDTI